MFDLTAWLAALVVLLGAATATWVVSVVQRNVTIVDSLWSVLFVLAAITYAVVMADTTLENYLPFSNRLCEAIAWRLKYMEQKIRNDSLNFQQRSLLLSKATDEIYKLSHKLENLASFDELTGLLNRRAIFERARNLLSIYSRSRAPISYIMIDIDHFKRINDVHGHHVGDEVLIQVSRQLIDITRSAEKKRLSDTIARFGGEEFAALLPDTQRLEAAVLAERIRTTIERGLITVAATRIQVTVSIGIATLSDQGIGDSDRRIPR